MYKDGTGIKQSNLKVVEYWQKACTLKNGIGCSNLGVMYKNGTGVPKTDVEAMKFYQKARYLDNSLGCINSGVIQAYSDTHFFQHLRRFYTLHQD
jgi:TPR repeat protein